MMRVWSHRPKYLHLGLFFAAYVLGCGFAQSLAIVPGTGISIWPPSGLFIATLVLTSRYTWPWWVLGGCLAELFSNFLWFHSPLPAAFLMYAGNALEAVTGAWLVNRTCKRPVRLETLQEVLAFVALAAGIAPIVSATVGSATLQWFGMQSQTFAAAWPLWWIGDATGVLIVAPLALVVLQNWRGTAQFSAVRWLEACVLGLIFLGVAALSLSGYLPFTYIIMPPLLWAAVRFEFKGAAVTLTLLALITAVFTISGASQFAGDPEAQKHNQIMLQLFLAISAFSALIVAAISRQHQLAMLTLRESLQALSDRERELSLIVEMIPAHIARMGPDGEPTFFSKRTADYIGLEDVGTWDRPDMSRLATIIGAAVHPDDGPAMREALSHALATGEPYSIRYRLRRADGVYRWREGRAEPLRDQSGGIVQWYAATIDIDDQVRAEEALRRSERQLQEMIDAVPIRIWSATPAGGIVYFNKRYQDHFRSVIPNFEPIEKPRIENLLQELVHPEDAPEVERTLRSCFETGGPSAMRFRWLEKDGAYRWAECRVGPRRDQEGAIVQWYGVSLDIDDEMRAQEALRDSERELSQLVDMIPSHVWRLSPDGEPVFFNKQMVDFLGLKDADTDRPGKSRLQAVVETVHPDDAPSFNETLHHSLATGERFAMQYRLRGADGIYRWMSGRAEPMRDDTGRIVQWFGLSHDIDDQMRLHREIEEREAKIRRLVDSDIIGIVIWELDGTLIDANDAFLRMVQYDRDDLNAGLDWLAMTPPEWQEVHAREEAEELMTTGKMQARKKEFFRKDGSRVPVLIGAACFEGQSTQGVAYILDLTERKSGEAALRDRERELAKLVDTVPVQLWSVAPGGDPAYINKTMTDYIGLKLEDFDADGGLPSAIQTIVHPDDRAGLLQGLTQSFESGERFELKFRNRRWDGEYRWTEGHADPLRDESGRIIRWYGANVDIHDHVISQEALLERERFLWQLVETLPAMIDCAAPDGEPVYRSQQLREFLGYQLETLDGTGKSRLAGTLDAGVHPDDVAGVKEKYAHSLSTGEPYARRHRLRRFDGEYRWVETRAAPMRNVEGAIVQWNVICLDIDGEVRAQEQLRLAQENLARQSQAASLAELSASIAHEVNQPLAAVVANSHACQRWLTAEPPNLERAQKTLERVIRDANSAADVVSHIRALFKQSVGTGTTTTLSGVIAEARDLMAEEATRRRVSMSIDVESNLPPVALGRIQIQQVLVNLIRNGMDAMDSLPSDRVLGIRVRRTGDVIQTEISDRGRGVEFPERIFEPFFTTKEHGMGMGLAICRSTVESHGGRLWVEKNEPHGAKFIFTLPVEAKVAA